MSKIESSSRNKFYPYGGLTSSLLTRDVLAGTMSGEGMEVSVAVLMEKPNGDGWAHLVSDLCGEKGRAELRVFLKHIGIRRPLHRTGTYAEHCDIRGPEIALARQAGAAVISRRELARLLRKKKSGEENTGLARLAGDR